MRGRTRRVRAVEPQRMLGMSSTNCRSRQVRRLAFLDKGSLAPLNALGKPDHSGVILFHERIIHRAHHAAQIQRALRQHGLHDLPRRRAAPHLVWCGAGWPPVPRHPGSLPRHATSWTLRKAIGKKSPSDRSCPASPLRGPRYLHALDGAIATSVPGSQPRCSSLFEQGCVRIVDFFGSVPGQSPYAQHNYPSPSVSVSIENSFLPAALTMLTAVTWMISVRIIADR